MKKGLDFEKEFSKKIHAKSIPVLISPMLLRSFNLGQVDLAILEKCQRYRRLTLYECKSSIFPSKKQFQRLLRTQDYLSRVLDIETKLEVKFCQKDQPSLFF